MRRGRRTTPSRKGSRPASRPRSSVGRPPSTGRRAATAARVAGWWLAADAHGPPDDQHPGGRDRARRVQGAGARGAGALEGASSRGRAAPGAGGHPGRSMRGRSTAWYRIRVNLIHVPAADRPAQEPLETDYDPWAGFEWPDQVGPARAGPTEADRARPTEGVAGGGVPARCARVAACTSSGDASRADIQRTDVDASTRLVAAAPGTLLGVDLAHRRCHDRRTQRPRGRPVTARQDRPLLRRLDAAGDAYGGRPPVAHRQDRAALLRWRRPGFRRNCPPPSSRPRKMMA